MIVLTILSLIYGFFIGSVALLAAKHIKYLNDKFIIKAIFMLLLAAGTQKIITSILLLYSYETWDFIVTPAIKINILFLVGNFLGDLVESLPLLILSLGLLGFLPLDIHKKFCKLLQNLLKELDND